MVGGCPNGRLHVTATYTMFAEHLLFVVSLNGRTLAVSSGRPFPPSPARTVDPTAPHARHASTMPPSSSTAATDGSASSIAAGAATGYHLLKIEGYSRIRFAIHNGKHVESHPFRAVGHMWSIRCYPNGECPDTAEYISIYRVLKESLVFSFIDQVEKQKPSYIRTIKTSKYVSHGSWGQKTFQSGRLKDDCFTVRCDIVVIGEPRTEATTFPGSSFVVVPLPDSSQHFHAFLLGGKGADVRFLVTGESFDAHRCVLAARSPVFDALLFGPMKEGTNTGSCIRIQDMQPQTEGQDKEVRVIMTQHLLEAVDRYCMERLKLICEERLCRYIDVSTVATSLALAEQHRCQGLKKACFEFLKQVGRLHPLFSPPETGSTLSSLPPPVVGALAYGGQGRVDTTGTDLALAASDPTSALDGLDGSVYGLHLLPRRRLWSMATLQPQFAPSPFLATPHVTVPSPPLLCALSTDEVTTGASELRGTNAGPPPPLLLLKKKKKKTPPLAPHNTRRRFRPPLSLHRRRPDRTACARPTTTSQLQHTAIMSIVSTMPSSPSTASTDGSASSIAAGAASGYHLLKIEGYSNIKSTIPNGKHVESHPFRAAGRTWSIKYYPNGECPDTADYISIFLVLKEAVTNHLMVQLVFSFIDEVEKHKPSYVRAAKVHKFDSHESWGYDKFVKRAELEQSGRLKDDCFTVRCDIVVIGEPRTKANTLPGSSFVVAPPPDSSHHLGALLLGGKGADVRFLVTGESF
ncbi:hypothetical protein HU200_021975 [Digitaria exilis]|uniref:Uncharacterized protein n=1 Tax=Digitaria exilis TaxID=1010633 RepID=A0A835EY41_9POAL|nr:hypothetical protein HU200_021975 [Digitaria exilis]